ncbi:hypothetical protein C8R47DRAFT_1098310 [Mycena vitilis]|nr:hypothetical protein C8R47DRAFT_1098310 [Mycena vitilis]
MQFTVEITAYGFEGRHVKIQMESVIPPGVSVQAWLPEFARAFCPDIKHSGKWLCSECGKPARDAQYDIMSWLHLPEPKLVIYVHQLCETKDGPCDRSAKAESDLWRREAGHPPNPPNSTRNINPVDQPLSRGCVHCHRDPFEAPKVKLKRCGRCKLTRYCSVGCQTADWNRHKSVCKSITGIEYGKWDADDRD